MKTYRFKNATVYVHGEISRERLRKATIKLVKQHRKYNIDKGEISHGNTITR